jgi:hypothetical protein
VAAIRAAAITTRIREVLEDGAGTLRTISSTRFLGDLPEGLSDDAALARSTAKPRVEATIVSMAQSAASPPDNGNLHILDIEVDVKVVRIMSPVEQLDDDSRSALLALAIEDADMIRQALRYAGNLTQTTAGTACDLVSNCLAVYRGSSVKIRRAIDEGAQPVETLHRFLGRAISRPAT